MRVMDNKWYKNLSFFENKVLTNIHGFSPDFSEVTQPEL
jgi:hypothetical protein